MGLLLRSGSDLASGSAVLKPINGCSDLDKYDTNPSHSFPQLKDLQQWVAGGWLHIGLRNGILKFTVWHLKVKAKCQLLVRSCEQLIEPSTVSPWEAQRPEVDLRETLGLK